VLEILLIHAKNGKYVELPYSVKGMDITLSGIQTNIKQKINNVSPPQFPATNPKLLTKKHRGLSLSKSKKSRADKRVNYNLNDLAYSLQETVFAMLVETAERALAHTGKKELLLGGGVACNKRLQEMCRIMCKERGAKLFVLDNSLLVDNGGFIGYLGEIMFKKGIRMKISDVDILPRQRTDDVDVNWK